MQPLIKTVLNGYNATVFAYGPTGTGKTFTMLGNQETYGLKYSFLEVVCWPSGTFSDPSRVTWITTTRFSSPMSKSTMK